MSDEQVQWQETILHAGTVEERDAAYAAFRLNKNGQYFVYGGPRVDKAPAPASPKGFKSVKAAAAAASAEASGTPTPAEERAKDLARRLQESRDRRAGTATGNKEIAPKTKAPVKPESVTAEAERTLSAFMGHNPR